MTGPQGVPARSTSVGTPRSPCGAARHTTATQPAGSGSGGAPGHTSRTSGLLRAVRVGDHHRRDGQVHRRPVGHEAGALHRGDAGQLRDEDPAGGCGRGSRLRRHRAHNGDPGGVFQATGPRARPCLSTGRNIADVVWPGVTKRVMAEAPYHPACQRPDKGDLPRHASPREQRGRRPVEPERLPPAGRPDPPGRRDLRLQRLRPRRAAQAPAQAGLPPAAGHHRPRRAARGRPGRRRRAGDEGLGPGEGRHALHPLVPAPHRLHRGEARLVLRPGRRRHRARPVHRQGAHQGRAGRVELPDGRHPRHVRGPRLHRVGPDQPGVHHREPERRVPLHPHGVRVVDGRGPRHQDPAPALDGGAEQGGAARAQAVRRQRDDARLHHDRARAGVLPDRRELLLRPAGPGQHGPHAVRREAARRATSWTTTTSGPSRSGCSPTCSRSRRSSRSSACRSRPATTRWRPASTRSRRSSRARTSAPTTSSSACRS